MPLLDGFDLLIIDHLDSAVHAAAEVAKGKLIENLSQPGHGRHYKNNPNRSSAKSEFPAQQWKELVESIDAAPLDFMLYGVGAFHAPFYARKLEFAPKLNGGRPWLSRTMESPGLHRSMTAAARRVG